MLKASLALLNNSIISNKSFTSIALAREYIEVDVNNLLAKSTFADDINSLDF